MSPIRSAPGRSPRPGNGIPTTGRRARLAHGIIAILVAAGLPGCGGGGGGGGSSPSTQQSQPWAQDGVASAVSTTPAAGNRFEIEFTLQTNVTKDVGATIEYSEDLGATYSAATLVPAPGASLAGAGAGSDAYGGTPTGRTHQVTWDAAADLSSLSQHDLVIRISPYNLDTSSSGTPASSDVFGIGTSNAPVVTGISTPGSTVGGWVRFTYTVSDAQGDHVSIEAQHSVDDGLTYVDSTIGQGDGTDTLAAPAGGTTYEIYWHAQEDVPEDLQNDVKFRIRASDTQAGTYDTSGTFSIQTYKPSIDLLTVNAIPSNMNGSTTFTNSSGQPTSYSLLMPRRDFLIWIEADTHFFGAPIDDSSFSVSSGSTLGGGASSGGYDADADFGAEFTVDAPRDRAVLLVGASTEFPTGQHTITATVMDDAGNVSDPVSYSFYTRTPTANLEPFDTADNWYVTFNRDNFTITSSIDGSNNVTVSSNQTPNGVADFVEDLRILGLNDATPVHGGLNGVVEDLVKEATISHLNTLFARNADGSANADSPNITFNLTLPAGTPSRIAVGGDDPVPGYTIGRAEYDYRNATRNNNTAVDLGVFTTNLIDFYINSSFSFKNAFDPLIAGRGTPVGDHAEDPTVLAPGFDPDSPANSAAQNARYDDIADAVDAFARVVAVVLAHEIGHSVGLVANGAPRAGLFGGENQAAFSGAYTTSFHLDTPGNNIMAASISFSGAISTGSSAPFFNELNLAYLQHRLLLE